ncbi:MAG: ABC transporter ATP-binding protein [Acidimicrobiia bacterium]
MSNPAVETRDLTKQYRDTLALDSVALSVQRGSVYGLVGPNGAGKTTLLGILSGLRRQTAGTFSVDAVRIGVLSDTPSFDSWLTAYEVVDLSRSLNSPDTEGAAVDHVLHLTGLSAVARRKVGGFSRGMLQRLGLAAAVVGEPDVLLLDEPAAALDPAGRREVLDMVTALRGTSTVVFSSHILDDVQQVCDTVGILKAGRIVYEGTLAELVSNTGHDAAYRIRIRGNGEALAGVLKSCEWTTGVELDGDVVTVSASSAPVLERELMRCLARADVPIVSVAPIERSLEDVFLEVTQ